MNDDLWDENYLNDVAERISKQHNCSLKLARMAALKCISWSDVGKYIDAEIKNDRFEKVLEAIDEAKANFNSKILELYRLHRDEMDKLRTAIKELGNL